MRGALCLLRLELRRIRFIPAHAGSTIASGRHSGHDTVHPRACGEHSRSPVPTASASGSSPRMRGARFSEGLAEIGTRFIPAHAGSTMSLRPDANSRAVHPRACGEHVEGAHIERYAIGSSPRMRGAPRCCRRRAARPWFIPAHAGSTRSASRCSSMIVGSSPRMRGARSSTKNLTVSRRFIPAHAGSTGMLHCLKTTDPVHPRACGEHNPRRTPAALENGSSPRMRGAHSHRR